MTASHSPIPQILDVPINDLPNQDSLIFKTGLNIKTGVNMARVDFCIGQSFVTQRSFVMDDLSHREKTFSSGRFTHGLLMIVFTSGKVQSGG